MNKITNITVLGTGVLGSQIAFQTAYNGFKVTAYDINEQALEKAKQRFHNLAEIYKSEVPNITQNTIDNALQNITYSSQLSDAVKQADLIIEAVPEDIHLKQTIYTDLSKFAPQHTIFATNSSTLLPSQLMPFTGRPDKFLALHFANSIWKYNTAEVMGTEQTSPQIYQQIVEFSKQIGMVPIEIKKEKAGYIVNSLLVPLLNAASNLLVDGIAEPEMIDKTWRISTGAPHGPFEIFDVVGLNTAYNVSSMGDEKQKKFAQYIKQNYIDQGKLGVQTGEGFYKYPPSANP